MTLASFRCGEVEWIELEHQLSSLILDGPKAFHRWVFEFKFLHFVMTNELPNTCFAFDFGRMHEEKDEHQLESTEKWPIPSDPIYFESERELPNIEKVKFKSNFWMVPRNHNQLAFDSVLWLADRKQLVFVKPTIAASHKFKPKYVAEFFTQFIKLYRDVKSIRFYFVVDDIEKISLNVPQNWVDDKRLQVILGECSLFFWFVLFGFCFVVSGSF